MEVESSSSASYGTAVGSVGVEDLPFVTLTAASTIDHEAFSRGRLQYYLGLEWLVGHVQEQAGHER
jgi:hypothetical protein